MLVDAGSGLGPGATMLAAAADQAVIVSTPEPTSIADAHAAIGRFRRLAAPPRLRVVVNQAGRPRRRTEVLDRLVASSRQFLGAVVSPLGPGASGPTPRALAVRGRRPFLTAFPGSPASRGVRRLARPWSASASRSIAAGGPASSRPRRPLGSGSRGHRLTCRVTVGRTLRCEPSPGPGSRSGDGPSRPTGRACGGLGAKLKRIGRMRAVVACTRSCRIAAPGRGVPE